MALQSSHKHTAIKLGSNIQLNKCTSQHPTAPNQEGLDMAKPVHPARATIVHGLKRAIEASGE